MTSSGVAIASRVRTARLPIVGNTVDVPNATYTNSIGAPELITVWTDPKFDPSSARFTTLVSSRFRRRGGPRTTPSALAPSRCPARRMTITERAYTSPIWYTP